MKLVCDVLVFETVDCLWLNYMIPESVRNDVQKALRVLQMIAFNTEFLLNALEEVDYCHGTQFDASSYFFVSKQLAKRRPALVESYIVLAYRNHFPGLICRTWPHYHKELLKNVAINRSKDEEEGEGTLIFIQMFFK